MKRNYLALLLSLTLILSIIFSGCGNDKADSKPGAAVEESRVSDEIQPEETLDDSSAEAIGSDTEEAQPITGAVIPKDELDSAYAVKYGMYDFEEYVELPLTEQEETLTYWLTGQPFTASMNNVVMEDLSFYRELKARTNINIEFTLAPFFTASESFGLMTAAGDYNDLIARVANYYPTGAAGAIQDEVVIGLNDVVAQYMPNYMGWLELYPDYRRAVTSVDGDIYMAGSFRHENGAHKNTTGMLARKDWMDELGIDMPVTYDDYHEMLTAFKSNYNSSGLWLDNIGRNMHSVSAAGYDVVQDNPLYDPLVVVDGQVAYSPITDNSKEFFSLLNSWWNEGLIWTDFMSQERVDYPDTSLIANGTVGIWSDDIGNLPKLNAELGDGIEVAGIAPPRKEAGQVLHTSYNASVVSTGGTSISTDCKNVELAAKWLDYVFTYDGYLLENYGIEGEALEFRADGTPQYTELVVGDSDLSVIQRMYLYSCYGGHGILLQDREYQNYTDYQREVIDLWNEDFDSEHAYPQGNIMTVEENTEYSAIMTDIRTYISESTIKFIIGDLSIDEDWETYTNNVSQMGIDGAVAIAQTAYDRYMAG